MDTIQLENVNTRPKAPAMKDVEMKFSARAVSELDALLTHYPDKKSAILPALWIAQREYGGWLPTNAIAEVALRLGRSYAEIEGVATFYTMYHPGHHVGKHLIEVCTCLSCHVCGAYRIGDMLKQKLGIEFGGTTEDGLITLEEVECLDACDRAPVLQVGDEYIGPVGEQDIDALIARLRSEQAPNTVKLADEIVKAQLHKHEQEKLP